MKWLRPATNLRGWLISKGLLALGSVAVADLLFYGQRIGLSLVLFLRALGLVTVISNRIRAHRAEQYLAVALLIASLLPLVEAVGFLAVCFGILGVAGFAILMTSDPDIRRGEQVRRAFLLPWRGPSWLIRDGLRTAHLLSLRSGPLVRPAALIVWIVPALLVVVFLGLFSEANPLIEEALASLDLLALLQKIEPLRCIFWMLILCAVWPFVHLRALRPRLIRREVISTSGAPGIDSILGEKSIVRALVLCNALFLAQTVLDGSILWAGFGLPRGMSYASYAHRGAYPLVVTALLAAGFILVAMRPGGPADRSRVIRPLVLAWIAQNLVLVISSIFRLDLYIDAYSLTEMRLDAFLWMILVLIGLVLILAQIVRAKSIRWLVGANAISLTVVLYLSCFLNVGDLVASFNIAHSAEAGGNGPKLDIAYLMWLGPDAMPALDTLPKSMVISVLGSNCTLKDLWYVNVHKQDAGWRDWSFRSWRLHRYLAAHPMSLGDIPCAAQQ